MDADNGDVILRDLTSLDAAQFDGTLATLNIGQEMKAPLPWPYGDTPPQRDKEGGKIRYWQPDPDSGMILSHLVTEGPSGEDSFIVIQTVRSRRTVNASTGQLVEENDQIDQADEDAFERWTTAVELAEPQ